MSKPVHFEVIYHTSTGIFNIELYIIYIFLNMLIMLPNSYVTWAICLPYLILVGDLFVGEVGDRHLVVVQLPDLMLMSLAGLPGVEEVSQGLVVNLNKARCEGELR